MTERDEACSICIGGRNVDGTGRCEQCRAVWNQAVLTERARIVAELRSYAEGWEQYTGYVPANNMNTARRTVLLHAAERLEQGKDIRRGD